MCMNYLVYLNVFQYFHFPSLRMWKWRGQKAFHTKLWRWVGNVEGYKWWIWLTVNLGILGVLDLWVRFIGKMSVIFRFVKGWKLIFFFCLITSEWLFNVITPRPPLHLSFYFYNHKQFQASYLSKNLDVHVLWPHKRS